MEINNTAINPNSHNLRLSLRTWDLKEQEGMLKFMQINRSEIVEIIQSSIAQSVKLHRKSFFVRMARFIKTKNENQCKSRFQKKQPELLREIFVPEVIIERYLLLKSRKQHKCKHKTQKQLTLFNNLQPYYENENRHKNMISSINTFNELKSLFSETFMDKVDNESVKMHIKDFIEKLPSCVNDETVPLLCLSSLYELQPQAALSLRLIRER